MPLVLMCAHKFGFGPETKYIHNMSWSGIKKAINRAGTLVLVKTGQIEQSRDTEYEHEKKRFKQMEATLTKLNTELRSYLESLRILTNAQLNVGEALGSFYGEDSAGADVDRVSGFKYSNLSQEYAATMKDLNEKTLADLVGPYNQTVLDPVAKFNSYFIEVNEAMKKRNNKQLDYDAMKSKVRKMIERSSNAVGSINPNTAPDYETKLKDAQDQLVEIEKTYNTLNDQLKQDLPKLVDLRTPFLDPSFELFVKIQLRFFNENYKELNGLQVKLDLKTREDYINGSLEKRVDDVLGKMRELNITTYN